MSRKIHVKGEIIAPSPLAACRAEQARRFKDEKNAKMMAKPSSLQHSKFSSCLKCCSSRQSNNSDIDEYEIGPKRVKDLNLVSIRIAMALDFISYRLQKQCKKWKSHISGRIAKWAKKGCSDENIHVLTVGAHLHTLFLE